MGKNKRICLFLVSLLLLTANAVWGKTSLDSAIVCRIVHFYNLDTDNTEIEIVKNRIEINPGDYDSLHLEPLTRSEPRGLLPLRVELFNNGQVIEKGQIRVRIRLFDYVLVTADKIRRNEELTPNHVTRQRCDITYLNEKPVKDVGLLSGYRAKRKIGIDQILTSGLIEKIPVLEPGQEVSIVCSMPGVEISAAGVVMESGYTGETIRVRNSQSRKIVNCTIIDSETVQVALQ